MILYHHEDLAIAQEVLLLSFGSPRRVKTEVIDMVGTAEREQRLNNDLSLIMNYQLPHTLYHFYAQSSPYHDVHQSKKFWHLTKAQLQKMKIKHCVSNFDLPQRYPHPQVHNMVMSQIRFDENSVADNEIMHEAYPG